MAPPFEVIGDRIQVADYLDPVGEPLSRGKLISTSEEL
jgi:hypothetical protein